MPTAVLVARDRMPHQHNWCTAMGEGLVRHGWTVKHTNAYELCDLVCFWGVRMQDQIKQAQNHGSDICILERGYIGDRKHYTSVSFGGQLNGRAEFRGPLQNPSRWEQCGHSLQPWDPQADGYALIMGQVQGDASVTGVRLDNWYRQARLDLEAQGWVDIRFRPHPITTRVGTQVDLATELAGAALVVTYNSNSGVDAILAGRPVIAYDHGSMVWELSGQQCPDRLTWAHAMAWKQWTKDEMQSGECWEALGCR